MQVNMHEAKSKLSALGEKVWKGEKVIIAKAGKPYLDLLPHRETHGQRQPGRLKGRIEMSEDFDSTPDDVIRAFDGNR